MEELFEKLNNRKVLFLYNAEMEPWMYQKMAGSDKRVMRYSGSGVKEAHYKVLPDIAAAIEDALFLGINQRREQRYNEKTQKAEVLIHDI